MSVARAKELRALPTICERRMWLILHAFRADGFHFRKQVPIGPYYADFACHHAKLVIEVDGDTHGTDASSVHDTQRDAFLARQGYTVLRFGNVDVMRDPNSVFNMISIALEGRPKNFRSKRRIHGTDLSGSTRL